MAAVAPLAAQPQPPLPACDAPALLGLPAEVLADHLPRCEKNPAFLLRLGQLRSEQGRYEQAADHIERSLMLAPEVPDALLHYAIALAGSGDTRSALNLLADLRQRTDLPQPLRASLATVLATWQPRLQQRPIWGRGGVPDAGAPQATVLAAGLRLGYDSNLQGASHLSSLTLTLPGQVVTLPIEPAQQPRAGMVGQADARLSHRRLSPDGARWGLQAAVQQRTAPALASAGSSQAEWQFDYALAPIWQAAAAIEKEAMHKPAAQHGALPLAPPAPPAITWAPWFNAGMAALHTPGGTRYLSHSLSLGLERAAGRCATRWAVDRQQRQLRSNPVLSSRYLGASVQWQCAHPGQAGQWLAVLRAGQDRAADPSRPGGNQGQAGLRLHLSTPAPSVLSAGALWLLDADYAYSRDSRGYSPILQSNRVRDMHRLTTRVEWQQPLQPGLQAVLGAEVVTQRSSLELFQVRSHGLWLGVRGQW